MNQIIYSIHVILFKFCSKPTGKPGRRKSKAVIFVHHNETILFPTFDDSYLWADNYAAAEAEEDDRASDDVTDDDGEESDQSVACESDVTDLTRVTGQSTSPQCTPLSARVLID